MRIDALALQRKQQTVSRLRQDRLPFWNLWRDLANYILPTRYTSLQSKAERAQSALNSYILDSTGTRAARTLAAGMMNGITSPARPWFKLRQAGFEDDLSSASRIWLDECERRMMQVMAESNFYQAIAVTYQDLGVFGTASTIIYDDPDKVIHCHNNMLGEFYLMIDASKRVCGIARDLEYNVYQLVQEFGEENCSEGVRDAYKAGGARHLETRKVTHLIEPNDGGRPESLTPRFSHREFYWEEGSQDLRDGGKNILRIRGFVDFPGICPRWELAGNDAYGTSPGMDALPDIKQLQHETKTKGKALDKMVDPPMLADISLKNSQTNLLPRGITWVPRLEAGSGMRPAYQVNPPVNDLRMDIMEVQQRIRDSFFNFLFNDIQQLDTVRSAEEISARREEKLILLGPVLQRFENECLDPAIRRIFGIMSRNQLFTPAPPELRGADLTIQYVSILANAQSAVGTAPFERLMQFIGSLAAVYPEARLVPNVPDGLVNYARDIGVKASDVHTKEEISSMIQAQNDKQQQQEQLAAGTQLAQGAQTLSQTDVGGGGNALQRVLGQ